MNASMLSCATEAARLQSHAQLKSHRDGGRACAGVFVTTMVDFYALPSNWPKRVGATGPSEIENAMSSEIATAMGSRFRPERFLPFVMMHEFEALLFSDCATFCRSFEQPHLEPRLAEIRAGVASPEEINDSPHTAPSKRILQLMPGYQKIFDEVNAARAIGLDRMRAECPHFNEWLEKLVALRAQV